MSLVEHRPETPLGGFQRFFGRLLGGHIPNDARKTAPTIDRDLAGRKMNRKYRPFLRRAVTSCPVPMMLASPVVKKCSTCLQACCDIAPESGHGRPYR